MSRAKKINIFKILIFKYFLLSIILREKKTKIMKGTIIPITFVAITKEQVRDEKNIFLYEGLSKKLIAKKRLIIKKDKKTISLML